jgi:18S rRNA (guanine1575-N7)-methyltransferase
MSKRPEGSKPPDLFYDSTEAKKYEQSSRMNNIQAEISERAIEMLNLPTGKSGYILDIGCGSGMSGEALEEAGHYWVGCDISESMLSIASEKESEVGDVLAVDMGQGMSIYLSIYLSVYLSFYLSVYLSIYLSLSLT